MAETAGKATGTGAVNAGEIRAAMGQLNIEDGKEQIKTEVCTFNQDGIYIGLKLVSDYDEATGKYKEERPSLVFMKDGKFVNMPKDGKFWKNFAEFAQNFAQIMEGIDLNTSINRADVANGQKLMAKYRTVQ